MHLKDTVHQRASCIMLYPNALNDTQHHRARCKLVYPNALKGYAAPQG